MTHSVGLFGSKLPQDRPRLRRSAAARKAAETFAKMPGAKVIKHAHTHRHMTANSSVLHSWDEKGNQIPFTLNVLNINSLDSQLGLEDRGQQ
jgi:hypothetical protein